MPIQLRTEHDGKIIIVQVSGKLVKGDYDAFVPEFDRLVRQEGKVRLLFDMIDFHGWEAGAAWQDLKLGLSHYSDIERIALVGETKWQHRMATFFKPFAKATVRYFDHIDVDKAHDWLLEDLAMAHAGETNTAHLNR